MSCLIYPARTRRRVSSTITTDLGDPASYDRTTGYVGWLYQKHPFGSDDWYDSMNRRSYVESSYGNIKNEAEQNLRRPSIRVMGRAKMTLVVPRGQAESRPEEDPDREKKVEEK